jgi:hypothetical protein
MKPTWCTFHSIYWESRPLNVSSITCWSSGGATQTALGILRGYNVSWLCHECIFTATVPQPTDIIRSPFTFIMILTQVSVPPERYELSNSALYFWWKGSSASYKGPQLQERIMGKWSEPNSGTFPRNGTQFCAVLTTSAVLWDTAGTRLVFAQMNDLTRYKAGARSLSAWLIWRTQNISSVGLSSTMNL